MKRGTILYGSALLVLILLNVAVVSAQKDAGYILLSERNKNPQVISVFNELGLSYDLIPDSKITSSSINLSNYRFLFIDDVRLNNLRKKPIWNYNSIIMNRYYGFEWGLTNRNGLGQFSSTSPLSANIVGNGRLQVYKQARTTLGGSFIQYYYVPDLNKGGVNYTSIARAFEGGGNQDSNGAVREFGDVVAGIAKGSMLANGQKSGGKICFFGVAKTQFWDEEGNAESLLKDCIGYVALTCSRDSDCPSPNIGNKFCRGDDVYQNFSVFHCNNPGQIISSCVESIEERKNKTCEFACLNGECIRCNENSDCDDGNNRTIDTCNNPNTIISSCTHGNITCFGNSDCGTDGLIGNPFCSDNKNLSRNYLAWNCNNPGTLNSSCTNLTSISKIQICNDTCLNGECRTITCRNNSDCNDGNIWTEDVCLNPNTINSSCIHNDIKCFANSDCGDDILSGLTCSGKNVVRQFTNFTCNNPGLPSSSCSNLTGSYNLKTCNQNCVLGQCVNINCTRDSDCLDLDDRTLDVCVNANTTASFCRHTEVNCLNDLDCGIIGFSGKEYCFGLDVFKNFQTSRCNNPGTLNSSCTNSISSQFISNCGEDSCGNYTLQCKNESVYRSRTCYDRGCFAGSCTLDTAVQEDKLQDCSFGCFQGACNPECTMTDLSRCGSASNTIYCQNSNLLVNTTITPACNNGTCSSTMINITTPCIFGCSGSSCLSGIHDVALIDFTDSFNGIKITNFTDSLATGDIICNQRYKFIIKARNLGNFSENVTYLGNVGGIAMNHDATINLAPGVLTSEKTKTINVSLPAGFYNVTSAAVIPIDDNPGNNAAIRQIKVICPACFSDAECNDGNASTEDRCVNPGTEQAFCNHTTIRCFVNSDCGSPSLSGNFCVGKNVTQNLTTPICNNAGLTSSYCSANIAQVVNSTCADYCSGGACQNFTCHNNLECGSPFLSELFCTANNVTRNLTTPTCNNPNTLLSSCVNITSSQLNKTCPDYCSGGACQNFTCHNNLECGSPFLSSSLFCGNSTSLFQNLTTPTCNNPNTILSSCVNITSSLMNSTCSFGCSNNSCNLPQCSDGIDNDGDGFIDFPNDPGCTDSMDNNETDIGSVCYAAEVVKYAAGTTTNGKALPSSRSNPLKALGKPEKTETYNFVSLGVDLIKTDADEKAFIILGFNKKIVNKPGNDFRVYETTFNKPKTCSPTSYPEYIKVYASVDNVTWNYLGTNCLDSSYDLGNMSYANYIKISDDINPAMYPKVTVEGYDLDGVEANYCV